MADHNPFDIRGVLREKIGATKSLEIQLGKIEKLKPLGEGGTAVVYAGELHGHAVAVKCLAIPPGNDRLKRFNAEYLNVQSLPPNAFVAQLLDHDQLAIGENIIPIIVMKRYGAHLKRGDKVDSSEVETLFRFLLDACEFLHAHGIIHRDVKPQNILRDGQSFRLSDFGIAHYDPELFNLKGSTKKGDRLANLQCSPPEQHAGAPASPSMDIYAIGQVIQWFVTGEYHRGTRRRRLAQDAPDLQSLDEIVEKCLANDPKERFQSILDIKKALETPRRMRDWSTELDLFSEACADACPKGLGKVMHIVDSGGLERLLAGLGEFEADDDLWATRGPEASPVSLRPLANGVWWMRHTEIKPLEAWVYHDLNRFNDVVVIKTAAMPPFGIYATNAQSEYEEAAIVDDSQYITRSEYDNGRGELSGQVVKLQDHHVDLRCRWLKEGTYVIVTRFHCAFQRPNENRVERLITQIDAGNVPSEHVWRGWLNEVRKHQHSDVERNL